MIQHTTPMFKKGQADQGGSGFAGSSPSGGESTRAGFSVSQNPLVAASEEGGETTGGHSNPGLEEFLGELTPAYGTRLLYLTARDPHCLYVYWDWDWRDFRSLLVGEARALLRIYDAANVCVSEVVLTLEAHNWYVQVPQADSDYQAEVGLLDQEGRWESVGKSNVAHTPNDQLGSEEGFSIASVPFHLHFQELLGTLQAAMQQGENLTQALGRLQAIGLPIDASGYLLAELSDEQKQLIEMLLGSDVWSRMQHGSLDLASLFRAELETALSSGLASESLLRARLAALIGGETSPFSGLVTSWLSGRVSGSEQPGLEQLSSGAFGSEQLAGATSSELLASWRAAVGETSWQFAAASASWAAALGFASGGFAAASEQFAWLGGSEMLGGGSEWIGQTGGSEQLSSYRAKLMSWFSAPSIVPTSSWFTAGPGMSELFSSWQLGVSSERLSSGAFASWGARRSFYMHVNAEVIFYGGTDPAATVWIDGERIALDANGNFRYHFKFPDADFEIPIVAESPDQQERRSAILSFKRVTRRQGQVESTGQPAHLGEPMGRIS